MEVEVAMVAVGGGSGSGGPSPAAGRSAMSSAWKRFVDSFSARMWSSRRPPRRAPASLRSSRAARSLLRLQFLLLLRERLLLKRADSTALR